ncbi:hypothetical protein AMTRI_Chr09g35390 [Amborella trichopoda]|uniref:Oxidoreductase-like domain-containing protein n=1 Tax=Amborella trichopoda TaxID=13333 RepID=W1NLF2_AMBTC|nr:hypothetical protein AMTR_s00001p00221310 [Amborella trichopoda]
MLKINIIKPGSRCLGGNGGNKEPSFFNFRRFLAMEKGQQEEPNNQKEEESKKEEEVMVVPPPPPPPEKPLPGDCCGSGCERCIWDIYYEDLEAYNERYPS